MNYLKTYVCESCFHIQKRYRKSSCKECKSKTFECDEWIAPVIRILNHKGYKTKYCCSGHPTYISRTGIRSNGEEVTLPLFHCFNNYIMFDIPFEELSKIMLPEGYEFDKYDERDKGNSTIRYSDQYNPCSYYDAIGHFHKSMKAVYRWANELPSRTALVVD
jgi:hypothetical protein